MLSAWDAPSLQNWSWGCLPDDAATFLRESPLSVHAAGPQDKLSPDRINDARVEPNDQLGQEQYYSGGWMLQTQVLPGASD